MLKKRNVLLGITGSIAAYKSADIARRLMEEGAEVTVVMTEAASRFITPYTLEVITGKTVYTDLFKDPLSHISLASDSDLFLLAPATANTINKMSAGIADNLITNLWLTFDGQTMIAPAMNHRMYTNSIVQKNIGSLRKKGVSFVGPIMGSLVCGDEGIGKMADVSEIVESAVSALSDKDLSGQKILITAGPTREPLDPVRFLSNRSSGKMGYALAKAAVRRGAEVTLISGPSDLDPPVGASFIKVERASEMESAVLKHLPKAGTLIMAAAVADFSPSSKSKVKLDKNDLNIINLKNNKDILKAVSKKKGRKTIIGFAAETGLDIERAKSKLKDKRLDLIVLNDLNQKGAGFDLDTNVINIIDKKGDVKKYPLMRKIEAADAILDELSKIKS